MGHFANQYWKSYSGLLADWGTNSNNALSADFRPFNTMDITPYYFINVTAPRDGFIRLSYHLSIVPDSNPIEAIGSMVITAKWGNGAGNDTGAEIYNNTCAAMTGGADTDGFYVLSGVLLGYVKSGTPIQFWVENTSAQEEWALDGYINGNVTLEYDR